MKQEINIPEVSEGVTSGTVVALSVEPGDQVVPDQTLLEWETDKAVVAIPSPFAGEIKEICVDLGAEVAIGDVVMVLETSENSQTQTEEDTAASVMPVTEAAEEVTEEPVAEVVSEPLSVPKQQVVENLPGQGHIAAAAPSVRRLARELGIDIHQVPGTGIGGRISAEDINTYVSRRMRQAGSQVATADIQRPLPDFSRFGQSHRQPLSKVRQLTAEVMTYAWSTIPMVTQQDEAIIGPVEEFRKTFNKKAEPNTRLTMTAFLTKVCAVALKTFPEFNSTLDLANHELIRHDFINIGVAVDTPAGLLVPVIREVDRKGIETIATELNTLAEKTRERKIGPSELEGGTFTISNLGGIGGTSFTPIVYAPQVAILGVSKAGIKPVWDGAEFVPQLVLPLCLTYDHRVIDGAAGARFLRWICQALENPLNLVMKDE